MYFHFYLRKGMILYTAEVWIRGSFDQHEPSPWSLRLHTPPSTCIGGNVMWNSLMSPAPRMAGAVVLKYAAVRSWSAFEACRFGGLSKRWHLANSWKGDGGYG